MKEFKNKVMFITGAAHGFGQVIALEAARRGMKISLVDIDAKALKATYDQITALGAESIMLPTDVTQEQAVDDAIDTTVAKLGHLDLLINDAGITLPGRMWELPISDWEWIMHINLMSQVYAMKHAIPIMDKQHTHGTILNVGSIAGLLDTPGMPSYHATKFASVGLTEATAYDLQRAGIDIELHIMCPGFVQTDLYHTENHEPKRFSNPDDPYYSSDAYKQGQQYAKQVITHGMPIDTIADTVFKALENNDFYILTHPEYNGLIKNRVDRILHHGAPDVRVLKGIM